MITLQDALKVARGNNQRRIVTDLFKGKEIVFKEYIASKKYYGGYLTSFFNLFDKLQNIGVIVEVIEGINGGYWTATAKITSEFEEVKE